MNNPLRALMLALACLGVAHAESFQGAGIFEFKGQSACPFTIAPQGNDCRQIALADGFTHAAIDANRHEIHLANDHEYAKGTLVADVFLPARAKDANGATVPLMLHAKITRKGKDGWSISAHGHAPVVGPFTAVEMEPWHILADHGNGATQLIDEAESARILANPSLAARLARQFVEVRDNRGDKAAGKPDITVLVGLGPLASAFVRSQLDVTAADPSEKLGHTLQTGTWALSLQSLSRLIPLDVTRHELFLYGVDHEPLLREVYEHGLKKDSLLVIGAKDGKGYLQLDGKTADFPGAAQAASRFMAVSFVGHVLAWQQVKAHGG